MTYILLTVLFVMAQGFYSGMETGMVSLLKPRVRHGIKENVRGARILYFFSMHPGIMISTTLVFVNICVVCSSNTAKRAFEYFGLCGPGWMTALTVFMGLVLLFVEIIMKNWFRQQPYERCLMFAYVLNASYYMLYFPVRALSAFTVLVNRTLGGRGGGDDERARAMMREDFFILLEESERSGAIDPEAADMLNRSLDIHGICAADVMLGRDCVKDLPLSSSVAQAVAFCRDNRISRAPVQAADAKVSPGQPWQGIFSVYDAFFNIPEEEWESVKVTECLRPTETISADSGFEEMLAKSRAVKSPLLVVTDPEDPSKHLGIATPIEIVRKIFG